MGETGRIAAEHGSTVRGTSGKFPQGDWMGRIYRCSNPHPGSAGSSNGISAVGQTGSDEKIHAAQKPKHLILEAPHPSPLSAYRGFFGCKHFSQTNEFLKANGLEPIDWQIENRAEQKTEE